MAPNSIVLYNGQHPRLTDALLAAFKAKTGINVHVRTNDGVVLADQLLQDGHSSPADVYLTENSPSWSPSTSTDYWPSSPPPCCTMCPQRDEPPSGDWAPIAVRISVLVYDPRKVAKSSLPRSILDLAQPAWKGKVAIAPTGSDFPPLVGAVIAKFGTRRLIIGSQNSSTTPSYSRLTKRSLPR